VVGLFCVNPDAGDYGAWEAEANQVVQRHAAAFADAGCSLGLRKGRDYWMQIDIDPSIMIAPPAGKPTGVAAPGEVPSPFQDTSAPAAAAASKV
jgi:hypothetical protein